MPTASDPTTMATVPARSASHNESVASGLVTTTEPRSTAQSLAVSESVTASGTVNRAPCEARTTFGLNTSTVGSAATTPAPVASALRNMAPRLPGFSMASATRTRSRSTASRPSDHFGATPMIPSGLCRMESLSKGAAATCVTATSALLATRAAVDDAMSAQKTISSMTLPPSMARPSSRAPSIRKRDVSLRPRRVLSFDNDVIRGFDVLVISGFTSRRPHPTRTRRHHHRNRRSCHRPRSIRRPTTPRRRRRTFPLRRPTMSRCPGTTTGRRR